MGQPYDFPLETELKYIYPDKEYFFPPPMPKKILKPTEIVMISGSRNFPYEASHIVRDFVQGLDPEQHLVVVGDARGVDAWVAIVCKEMVIAHNVMYADWSRYGKSAGILRNLEMLKRAHSVVAFWDGKSKGTLHAIKEAVKKKLPCTIIEPSGRIYDAREIINENGNRRRKKN